MKAVNLSVHFQYFGRKKKNLAYTFYIINIWFNMTFLYTKLKNNVAGRVKNVKSSKLLKIKGCSG